MAYCCYEQAFSRDINFKQTTGCTISYHLLAMIFYFFFLQARFHVKKCFNGSKLDTLRWVYLSDVYATKYFCLLVRNMGLCFCRSKMGKSHRLKKLIEIIR